MDVQEDFANLSWSPGDEKHQDQAVLDRKETCFYGFISVNV